uniref:Follistatin/Osteonectin EGF domain-containing protein n=1 Tax=Phlebotomus papatasi TaxID=29031 RepID=A0A1B0D6H3_PHLPP
MDRIFLLLAAFMVILNGFALAKLKDVARENELAAREAELAAANPDATPQLSDPCTKVHCGAGRICQADGQTAACVCVPECPDEVDPRRKVCTNKNETWPSDCEVYRQRCLCDTKDPACMGKEFRHIHIDYYGECRDMPVSLKTIPHRFPQFPIRKIRHQRFHDNSNSKTSLACK